MDTYKELYQRLLKDIIELSDRNTALLIAHKAIKKYLTEEECEEVERVFIDTLNELGAHRD